MMDFACCLGVDRVVVGAAQPEPVVLGAYALDGKRDPPHGVDFDLAADISLAEIHELDERDGHVRFIR